jgi:heparanase 1
MGDTLQRRVKAMGIYVQRGRLPVWLVFGSIFLIGGAVVSFQSSSSAASSSLHPSTMKKIGTVDERYQSYNVEMAEVTGGSFWKPYATSGASPSPTVSTAASSASVPGGMNPSIYQFRPPIDLTNVRRRKLTAALGPAYIRVSGTWANTTFFFNKDGVAPKQPPTGFNGVLTRAQWKGVVDFAHAVHAKIISSVAISAGARNASGVWTSAEAAKLYSYTQSIGGSIAAAEFMNEPTMAKMGGAPSGYTGLDYGRDVKIFNSFLKRASPGTMLIGPGSVGEGGGVAPPATGGGILTSASLLRGAGPIFDAFSYHFYGGASQRCSSMGAGGTTAADALSEKWLAGTDQVETFYASLRDKYEPNRPLWITETADTACGGNPWASTFLDSFRYLDQLGRLAKRGLKVIVHNTLDSSDYGLLDENTFEPRPNYWAALLWRTLMGTTVLNAGPSPATTLHLYAHCLRGEPGGVAVLAINTDRTVSQALTVPPRARRYTLSAAKLEDSTVSLNGKTLSLGSDDALPALSGAPISAGTITLAPATITFITIADANNAACK